MIMKTILFFLLLVQIIPANAQTQQNADSTDGGSESTLRTATGDIHGTLLTPEKAHQSPVVLIIAGSGPTDRNGNSPMGVTASPYRMLADSLLQHGIATLRYDKRGVAQSARAMRSESELTFENYIEDAVSWIKWLRTDKRFSRVIVLGHSEGSLIGMVAARTGNADAYISVSGLSDRADKTISKQLHLQMPQLADKADILFDSLGKGYRVQEPGGTMNMLFRASVQPYLISWFKYDPSQEIKKLTIPVLILQGTTDVQVSVADAQALKQADPQATLAIIDGMNHVLKTSPADMQQNLATYHDPKLPLKPGLVTAIDKFIRKDGSHH
jgi:alpha-beta hydrolase superfamily lysophospholipase